VFTIGSIDTIHMKPFCWTHYARGLVETLSQLENFYWHIAAIIFIILLLNYDIAGVQPGSSYLRIYWLLNKRCHTAILKRGVIIVSIQVTKTTFIISRNAFIFKKGGSSYLALCVVFCTSLFVRLYVELWLLYCLSFVDLLLQITTLVSSNLFWKWRHLL
jgi:hypothetical protein